MSVQLRLVYDEVDDPQRRIVTDSATFERLMRWLKTRRAIILDYETSGLAWFLHARICGVGLASWTDKGQLVAAYVPIRHRSFQPQLSPSVVLPAVGELLADPNVLKIAHNIKFEDHMTRVEGYRIEGPRYDTQIAAHLYDENRPIQLERRVLDDLGDKDAYKHSKRITEAIAELAKSNAMKREEYRARYGYSELDVQLCGRYCCTDLLHTGRLYEFYENWGASQHFGSLFQTEMELTDVLCDTESAGLPVDVEYLQRLKATVQQTKVDVEQRLWHATGGHEVNPGSDNEVRALLMDIMGLNLTKMTDKQQYAVDHEVLAHFAEQHEVCRLLLNWREADKLDTTYTSSILRRCDSNGLLYADLKQMGAATGRLSCENPNFQNFPADSNARALAATGKKLKEGGIDPWSIRRAFPSRGPQWTRVFLDYCLAPGTYVQTPSGSKQIGKLKAGDAVFSEKDGKLYAATVSRTARVGKLPSFRITFSNGTKVVASSDHRWPVHVKKETCWVIEGFTTENLPIDAQMVSGVRGVVGPTVKWLEFLGLREMVAITVEPYHNYVLGAGMVTLNSQIELRVLGFYSQDPIMVQAFLHGEDVHERTAKEVGKILGYEPERRIAKIVNFGLCIAKGQRVLTDRGLVPIELVRLTDRVWDGVEWVRHKGVVCRGVEDTIEWGGLRATPEHQVYMMDGSTKTLADIRLSEIQKSHMVAVGSVGIMPVHYEQVGRGESGSALPGVGGLKVASNIVRLPVYDLVDAGPRHRFTVEGFVVSNSYGMSPIGLSKQAHIPIDDAEQFLNAFFAQYAGVRVYKREIVNTAKKYRGQWRNIFGRRRTLKSLLSENDWEVRAAERQMIASAIQGTAAELTKVSLVRIRNWLRSENVPALICNTVHDEIQIDVPDEYVTRTIAACKQLMEHFPQLAPIPIVVDAEISKKTWADKQSYEG